MTETNVMETYFRPKEKIKRKDLVEALYRLADSPEVIFNENFNDIDSNQEYANSITWAVNSEIVSSSDNVKPYGNIEK